MVVFWDVAPCSLGVDRRFRGAYCLHHQVGVGGSTRLLRLHDAISQKTLVFILPAVELETSLVLNVILASHKRLGIRTVGVVRTHCHVLAFYCLLSSDGVDTQHGCSIHRMHQEQRSEVRFLWSEGVASGAYWRMIIQYD
jgi:hypothetical protein